MITRLIYYLSYYYLLPLKRKKFIFIVTALLAGAILPVYFFRKKFGQNYHPLAYPESLIELFNRETIKELGITYCTTHIAESDVSRLKQLLLADSSGNIYEEDDKIALGEMLKKEIKRDFESGRIVVVKGWILSLTEVRQCALFSQSDS